MPEPITLLGFAGGTAAITGHLARRHFEVAKECVDILLGAIALVVVSPVLAVCAIIIKVSSRGPILYSQVRVGKNGKLFRMYKLRTMRVDAETSQGAVWAEKDDPRIVKSCRWMRRSHIDELPQLISVIKGEMSLVGPRPERPEILEELSLRYPETKERLKVRPGITGLAQIRNGYDTSVEEFRLKLQSDMEYIANRKWLIEIRIMIRTLSKFFFDKNAH
jgi:lipopolysaccharide/colanic/teichoic acid biosynthesis glycosyltransferase